MVPATATSKTTTPLIEMIMTALAGVCVGLSAGAVFWDGSVLAVERIGNGRPLGGFEDGGGERGVLVLWDGAPVTLMTTPCCWSGLAVVVHVPGVLATAAVVAVVRLSGLPAVAVTETLVSTVVTLMVLLTGLGVGRNVVEGVRSTCGCGPPVATAGRPVAVGRVVGDVVVGAMVENVVVLQSIPQQVAGQLPRNSS